MRFTRLVVALAVVVSAGAAHAAIGSPISGNQVDDFGVEASSSGTTAAVDRPAAYASIIPGNQIDDFGVETPSGGEAVAPPVATGYASIIPGNQIDDFRLPEAPAPAEPSTLASSGAPVPRS